MTTTPDGAQPAQGRYSHYPSNNKMLLASCSLELHDWQPEGNHYNDVRCAECSGMSDVPWPFGGSSG